MNDNHLVAEVRAARREILDSFDGDVQAMLRDMMKRQYERGREFLKSSGKGPVEAGSATNSPSCSSAEIAARD